MPSLWIAGSDGRLVPLEAEDYSRERDFQAMLADNPMLLASALDAGETSVAEWLLIDRELPILSDEDENQTRWQLDHLFIDAQARPTLVEVKRSSDPRARREVVAQMLDYAASFGPDWSAERLRARFSGRQRTGAATAADAELESFLESTAFEDAQDFWREVDTNIDAGNIRLLFVADRLAPRLVNIIEYLNGQLQNAEVLGLEVLRHVDQASGFEAY